jgi:ankyrin repeat protein
LTWASWWGHTEVVRLLLERGADVNRPDYRGDTALMLASAMGREEIAREVLRAGADVQARDHEGRTP